MKLVRFFAVCISGTVEFAVEESSLKILEIKNLPIPRFHIDNSFHKTYNFSVWFIKGGSVPFWTVRMRIKRQNCRGLDAGKAGRLD